MTPLSSRPPLRYSAFALRTFIIFAVGWAAVVVLEIGQQADVIGQLAESTLRLAVWVALMGRLTYDAWRTLPWPQARYGVLVVAVCCVLGFALAMTEDIRALDQIALIGRQGSLNQLAEKMSLAGWACGIAYLFFALLRSLDQSHDERIRLAEQQMRANEKRFRDIFESSPDAIFIEDLDGLVLDVNAAACRLHGMDRQTLVGKHVLQLVPPEERESVADIFPKLAAGEFNRFEGFSWTRDERAIPVELTTLPMDYFGASALLLHVRDLTERKQAEAALREANDELEQRVADRTGELSQAVERLEQEIQQRKRAQETLQAIVEGTSTVTGGEFFSSLVRELARNLDVHSIVVCEALDVPPTRVRTLAFWVDDELRDNLEFDIADSPCEGTAGGSPTYYARNVQRRFPDDGMLAEMGIEGYCGIPMRDGSGAVIGHLCLMHDQPLKDNLCEHPIVRVFAARAAAELQRKQADDALRRSEQRLKTVLSSAPVVITSIGKDHVIDFLDGAALAAVGRKPGQFVGHDYFELWQDSPQLTEAVSKALRGETSELVAALVAGRTMETRCSPLRDSQGQVSGAITVCVDVTERKRAEEAQRLTQFAVDNASDAVLIFGPNNRFTYVNEAAARSLGYGREELLERAVFDVDPLFGQIGANHHWEEIRQSRRRTVESVHRRKDGGEFPVEVTSNYLSFEGREFVCAFARDLTGHKQREQESQRLRNELAHVTRVSTMGEMATGLAHEINQPLTAIANFADAAEQMLDAERPPPGELRRLTAQIGQQAFRAGEIVRRVREFVKRSEPKRSAVHVNRLIQNVGLLVETEARLSGVHLRLELAPELPHISADRIQIQQVVLNLLRNAFDALAGQADGLREVTIASSKQGREAVAVVVSDTGSGFPAEHAEAIFDAFRSTKPEGMGMGLAISRSIIEAHGGRVWATSEPQSGATFHLHLPVAREVPTES